MNSWGFKAESICTPHLSCSGQMNTSFGQNIPFTAQTYHTYNLTVTRTMSNAKSQQPGLISQPDSLTIEVFHILILLQGGTYR